MTAVRVHCPSGFMSKTVRYAGELPQPVEKVKWNSSTSGTGRPRDCGNGWLEGEDRPLPERTQVRVTIVVLCFWRAQTAR